MPGNEIESSKSIVALKCYVRIFPQRLNRKRCPKSIPWNMQSSTFRAYSVCSRTRIPPVYPHLYLISNNILSRIVKWIILHRHLHTPWHLKHLPPWPFLAMKVGTRAKRAFLPITQEWWLRLYLNTIRIPPLVAIVQITPRITLPCHHTILKIITNINLLKNTTMKNFWMWLQSGQKTEIDLAIAIHILYYSFFFVFDLNWWCSDYETTHSVLLNKYSWIYTPKKIKNCLSSSHSKQN